MIKISPITPIVVYIRETSYMCGSGASSKWNRVTSDIHKTYYCEWTGAYGENLNAAQALGVSDSARIRMVFNPDVYAALKTGKAVIVKGLDTTGMKDDKPDELNPAVYEVWSGVDDIGEAHQFLEFRVKRYQPK